MSENSKPHAQPPPEERPARTAPPHTVAAGLPALTSSARHAFGEMGLARSFKTLKTLNQKDGVDCPGCAWPEPDHRSPFEFCENGVKAIAEEATLKRVGPEFFAQHSVAELSGWSDHEIGKAGRLTHPMVLRPGATHYAPIAWDDAFALLAAELRACESPDEAIFYTSGRTSNEAAFLYQLFARRFGTNNLPDCANLCHESSGVAMKETLGVGKGTVGLDDFEKADVIVLLGQNPGTNHPRMLTTLQAASRRGAKIVAINPLPEAGLTAFVHPQEPISLALNRATPLACLHLPVKINGDLALLTGIAKVLLERGAVDREFVTAHTEGFEAFAARVAAAAWEDIERGSGLPRTQIQAAAEVIAGAKAMICCWAMGLTQHENAVATIQMVVNLLLLGGHVGRPGAGACPVRGHSNVQGDRSMGITPTLPPAFREKLGQVFAFEPPQSPGLDTVAAIQAMHAGKVRVFVALGGNFLSAAPDTEYTADALRRCKLTVHVSTKPNRSHLITGETALILPCRGRTEEGPPVSVEDSMSWVHLSRGNLKPASEHLLAEPEIVARLAKATLGPDSGIDWMGLAADYDALREKIAQVVPGFTDFARRVREPGGFQLPNAARERRFETATGKANFTATSLTVPDTEPGTLLMMTIRTHDQYNTTVYGLDDRYRGIYGGRRVVLLSPDDLTRHGLAAGDRIDLVSCYDGVERVAEGFQTVAYPIPNGCCATYFPEANVLVPITRAARKSNTPISKSVTIRLRRPTH